LTAADARPEAAVAHLAHALRSPLTIIVGYAELLRQRADPAVHADAPTRILEAAERLAASIDALLVAFADDHGSLDLDPVRISLNDAVESAVATVGARVGDDCTIEVHAPSEPIDVEADEEHVRRILEHLVGNAAMRTGKGTTVTVTVGATAEAASVSVTDLGPVIPADEVGRTFERFGSTVDPGARLTGLELYVARRLVELHGGSVHVDSAAGGTTLTATLPRAA